MSGRNVLYTDLERDIPQWIYKDPIQNAKGGFAVFINPADKGRNRIRFQAASDGEPKPRAPFGVSKPFADSEPDNGKRSFDMSIESPSLLRFLKGIDQNNVRQATVNCKKWFNKELTEDQVRIMYKPIVYEEKASEGYAPTFRTKVNVSDKPVKVYVVENKDGKVGYRSGTIDDITSGVKVLPIVEIVGLWFVSRQFGMSLLTTDVLVFPEPKRPEFDFILESPVAPMEGVEDGHGAPPTGDIDPLAESDLAEHIRAAARANAGVAHHAGGSHHAGGGDGMAATPASIGASEFGDAKEFYLEPGTPISPNDGRRTMHD